MIAISAMLLLDYLNKTRIRETVRTLGLSSLLSHKPE